MKLDHVLVALMLLGPPIIATATDMATNSAPKAASDVSKNAPREPKLNFDEWQPYFYWHRDAMTAKNRIDNATGRTPAVQL